MNKLVKIALGAILALVIVGGGAWAVSQNKPAQDTTKTATASPSPSLSPSAAPASTADLSYPGVDGKTALELLKAKDPTAVTKGEGTNAFVTTIGGYTASEAKKEFWAFYIGDKSSDVGAGSYVTKSTDTITWKLKTY